jgi:hypothetical protein
MDEAARAARHKGESALRRLIAAVLFLQACASPGMPPGGPPDTAAPQIIAIIPDSGSVGVKPKEVVFRFDEVVAERPASVTTLADLFLISPRDGVPDVSWHRDAIAVKPPHGWRANTPYTVILMRGLADIRGNVRNTGVTTFFSTGPSIPRTRISGQVFDWVTGAPAAGALVESFVQPDSIHPYVALVDAGGAFVLEHLPPARYGVRAYLDRNKNMGIDPSEPWDSVSVNVSDSARIELLLFVHDTVPPRLALIAPVDSQTLRVTFDKPLDPAQTLTAANFAVIGPDSVPVPIASANPEPRDTIGKTAPPVVRAPPPPRAGVTPRVDTTAAPRRVMSRPTAISTAIIKLQHPLKPKVPYRVRAIGIRGLLGRVGNSERPFTPPAPPAPPPAKPTTPPPNPAPSVKK